jgi:hypothetical protein
MIRKPTATPMNSGMAPLLNDGWSSRVLVTSATSA